MRERRFADSERVMWVGPSDPGADDPIPGEVGVVISDDPPGDRVVGFVTTTLSVSQDLIAETTRAETGEPYRATLRVWTPDLDLDALQAALGEADRGYDAGAAVPGVPDRSLRSSLWLKDARPRWPASIDHFRAGWHLLRSVGAPLNALQGRIGIDLVLDEPDPERPIAFTPDFLAHAIATPYTVWFGRSGFGEGMV
jgi:hypothetical protein